MTLNRLPNESLTDYKFRLLLDKAKGNITEGWKEVAQAVDPNMSESAVRIGTKFLPEYEAYIKSKLEGTEDSKVLDVKYKETIETLSDGSIRSDKLIELSKEDMLKPERIMELHGYDPKLFELTGSKHSMWQTLKDDGTTLYSSKVTVKPIKGGLDFDKIIEKLKNNIAQSDLKFNNSEEVENMLVIPLFDMHFGISTFETYEKQLAKIIKRINSKAWDKILIIFGQDALHNDNFTSQTTSGTIIEKVDMEKAWEDLHKFYTIIFDNAIKKASSVDAIFSNGNHDQSMGWAFGKLLEHQYPQVKFDSKLKQFKGYSWKNIFIGATHGDKGQARLFDVFLAEYGKMIANASTKEILSGHLHHTKTIDKFGLVHRTLGSGVPTDGYHADNAFVGAQKLFQLIEYNEDYPEAVYYI